MLKEGVFTKNSEYEYEKVYVYKIQAIYG